MNDVLQSGDAARLLEVSPERVRQLEAAGKLKAVAKTSRGMRLFERAEVIRLKRKRDDEAGAA